MNGLTKNMLHCEPPSCSLQCYVVLIVNLNADWIGARVAGKI